MKKHIKFTINIIAVIAFLFVGMSNILAYTLSDPQDIFQVTSPIPNSTVSGDVAIKFKSYDDDQSSIPYTIKLFDGASCKNKYFGVIKIGNGTSSKTNQNSINWNSKTTQSQSNLADGTYCLKVCVSYKKGPTSYSVCNGRRIKTVNSNKSPQITSIPPQKEFKEGEIFSYKVIATDPNGDKLTFTLINSPSFLKIDKNSGQIVSTALSTNGKPNATYTAVVKVQDGKGGSTTQTITIKVVKPATQPPTDGGNNDGSDDGSTDGDTPDPEVIDFKFIDPKENTVITENGFVIRWGLKEEQIKEIQNLDLQYSTDSATWKSINSKLDFNFNYFIWNITQIPNGESYYLKFIVKTKDNQQIEIKSDKFAINKPTLPENPPGDGDGNTTSSPLITDVKPDNNSEILENREIILMGKLTPSLNSKIEKASFKIKLDGRDYADKCQVNSDMTEFRCPIADKLELGVHYIEAEVKDSSGQTGELDWFFTIIKEQTTPTEPSDGSTDNAEVPPTTTNTPQGINLGGSSAIILIICIVIFLLLVIPWILYRIWIGGNKKTVVIEQPVEPFRNDNFADLNNNQGSYIYNPELDSQYLQTGFEQPQVAIVEPQPQTVVEYPAQDIAPIETQTYNNSYDFSQQNANQTIPAPREELPSYTNQNFDNNQFVAQADQNQLPTMEPIAQYDNTQNYQQPLQDLNSANNQVYDYTTQPIQNYDAYGQPVPPEANTNNPQDAQFVEPPTADTPAQ